MIYTVTFNPAIDYVVKTQAIGLGSVNRADSEQIYFGGKGIIVSAVLAELGVRSKALGFTAGFTGEAIEQGVEAMGIDADFVRLKSGNSRINVKIRAAEETELNGQGPDIDDEALSELFSKTATRLYLQEVSQTVCPTMYTRGSSGCFLTAISVP